MKLPLLVFMLLLINLQSALGQKDYLREGNSFLKSKDFDQAEKVFRKAIKKDPTNLVFQCQLGLTLIEKGKYEEAQRMLDEVLETDSLNVGANWYSGIGSFKNAKDRKAIMHFERDNYRRFNIRGNQ